MEEHRLKVHKEKTLLKTDKKVEQVNKPMLISCPECEFFAESNHILNEHVENEHNSDFWMVGTKRRKKNCDNEVEDLQKEEVLLLSKRRDKRILEKREEEDRQQEERKLKAEKNRLQDVVAEASKNKSKTINVNMKRK